MIQSFLNDPGFVLTVRWTLALVFILGVAHKLKSPMGFAGILENYRLLPKVLALPSSYLIILVEVIVIVALVLDTAFGSVLAAVVLTIYTSAILANLIRGRRDIDCGCSGPAVRQTLSYWLVSRNAGLIILALITIQQSNVRPITLIDWFTTVAAVATFALIYSTATQLTAVSARYRQY